MSCCLSRAHSCHTLDPVHPSSLDPECGSHSQGLLYIHGYEGRQGPNPLETHSKSREGPTQSSASRGWRRAAVFIQAQT